MIMVCIYIYVCGCVCIYKVSYSYDTAAINWYFGGNQYTMVWNQQNDDKTNQMIQISQGNDIGYWDIYMQRDGGYDGDMNQSQWEIQLVWIWLSLSIGLPKNGTLAKKPQKALWRDIGGFNSHAGTPKFTYVPFENDISHPSIHIYTNTGDGL